jgi:hypothetical protein
MSLTISMPLLIPILTEERGGGKESQGVKLTRRMSELERVPVCLRWFPAGATAKVIAAVCGAQAVVVLRYLVSSADVRASNGGDGPNTVRYSAASGAQPTAFTSCTTVAQLVSRARVHFPWHLTDEALHAAIGTLTDPHVATPASLVALLEPLPASPCPVLGADARAALRLVSCFDDVGVSANAVCKAYKAARGVPLPADVMPLLEQHRLVEPTTSGYVTTARFKVEAGVKITEDIGELCVLFPKGLSVDMTRKAIERRTGKSITSEAELFDLRIGRIPLSTDDDQKEKKKKKKKGKGENSKDGK